MNWYN